mmetsp:Transcript_158476/g.289007  ORF Transcript_158476/g.289007 Transcript_158476/m.289007 type:complete len:469 (+) Transcript_158476:83-1489(+)
MPSLGVFAIISFASAVAANEQPQPNYGDMWAQFKTDFGKDYKLGSVKGDDEEQKRFDIFKSNVDIIYKVNAQKLSYTLGVNQFADLTQEEFAAQYMGFKKPEKVWDSLPYLGKHKFSGKKPADSVDWTTKGAVTPVKNQGQCGSCWSFSTTGALEGAWKIATGQLTSLSEQQFVDCDHVDEGCNGGLMDNAFSFAEKNAICNEESYKYEGKKSTCESSTCKVGIPKGSVLGFQDVESSEQALMEAVAQQPVSIAIEADKAAFQLYHSGVLQGKCGAELDHGVLAVGYGTDGKHDYWKVKNSWGPSWGESGYIRLLRGKGKTGECGILKQPSYPKVSGTPGPAPKPPTPPTPPSPGSTHYEKPPCQSDEVDASIEGADGHVCAPKCDGSTCPTDVPPGTIAIPSCLLEDSSSGEKYCALQCIPNACPSGAKCAQIPGGIGVCVYPSSTISPKKTLAVNTPPQPTSYISV